MRIYICREINYKNLKMKKLLLPVSVFFLMGFSQIEAQYVAFDKGTNWSYDDTKTDLGVLWRASDYDYSTWKTGNAPLGYGDPVTTTTANGLITAYFIKEFTVDASQLSDEVELGIMRDDGIVVYLNGEEIVRNNMPSGEITYNTWSSTTIDGGNESVYNLFMIPKAKFANGNNRIAIELHNRGASSSDLRIDAYLKNPVIVTPAQNCTGVHVSCFTSIAPTVQTPKVIFPKEIAYQLILKEGDDYTEGGGKVGGLNDFTGYVAKNNSSTDGYLAVNHETNPGGMTVAEINYNATTKLWELTKSRGVNFSGSDLVQTARNCSGGITPWGTIITAEEQVTSSDSNGDGYKDYGWFVEIDPVTAEVKTYGDPNKKEKLWQMGIMNHENLVVNNEGTIAYYGEDGGTHCVYKYVLENPNDLSSGDVFVLKLESGLSGGDPVTKNATWIQVPNKTQADVNNLNTNARALGGTKFNGVEDVEINPIDGMVYFTAKGLNKVYRFKDNGTSVSDMETFVGGLSTSYTFMTETGAKSEVWGDGNDNLTFDEKGNLWVLQDGGKNYIWVVAPDHTQTNPKVTLFASMPAGSEPTGLTFTPDHKFGFFSIQHPSANIALDVDASGNTIDYRGKSATVVFAKKENLGTEIVLSTTASAVKKDDITISPNPTSGIINIQSKKGMQNPVVKVYNMEGRNVFSKSYQNTQNSITLDLTKELNSSKLLIVNIEADGQVKSSKVLRK